MPSLQSNPVAPWPVERDAESSPDSLFALGMRYANGQGVDVDYVEAHKWFNLAAQLGSSEARALRAEIARDMTREQIAEAQRQAREWIATHTRH